MKKFIFWWKGFTNMIYRWWVTKGRVWLWGAPAYGWMIVKKTAPESYVMLGGGLATVMGAGVMYDREPIALGVFLFGAAVFLVMFWRVRWLWRIAQKDS